MSLAAVKISEEVWLTCVTHALTTEKEEIMGLLFGDIEDQNGENETALIWAASPQMRSVRRKDRVETNPELLAAALVQAEAMTRTTGRMTRVIGWYHSHPHITVLPSHVDVRTQAMYQLMDRGFIGLIFSCFDEDNQKVGNIQVIAFQSLDGKQRNISPVDNSPVIEVDISWSSSDSDTGDSRVRKGTKRMREQALVPYNAESLRDTAPDSPDMTASMQEALHRSTMDTREAVYVRKEVPLHVVPTKDLLNLNTALASFTDVQKMLFEEEQAAYNNAIKQNTLNGKIHPLAYIHHTSTYHASLCKLLEYCLNPALDALKDRLKENEIRLAMLTEEAKSLEQESREKEVKHESPRRLHSPISRPSADSAHMRNPRGGGVGSRRKAI